jgi:drug/metabolite transporter (DMT)-like permease
VSARGKVPKEGLGVLGVGAAACAACCAGPILGLLAAIGIGTAAGVALFGVAGLLVAVIGAVFLMRRRARRQVPCGTEGPVPVELGANR